jgi:hypothetical protein
VAVKQAPRGSQAPADPQEIYARWLETGTRIAFAFGFLSLALYLSGVLTPVVPLQDLPGLWRLPAAELLRRAHAPGGWEWIGFVGRGDYLNLAAICLFSLLSLVCCARVIPVFLRRGERLHAMLAALQVLVLVAAAANLIPGTR